MPVKPYQVATMPQLHDKAQPRLQQTQGGLAHIVDQLLLPASNDVGTPQPQPGIDQRQGQQQTGQAVGMPHASEFQAKAAAVILSLRSCLVLGHFWCVWQHFQ